VPLFTEDQTNDGTDGLSLSTIVTGNELILIGKLNELASYNSSLFGKSFPPVERALIFDKYQVI